MQYFSSAIDFFYTSSADTLDYYITVGDEDTPIFQGKAIKNPSTGILSINVARIVRDWLETNMPDFRDFDGVLVPHPRQMRMFSIYSNDRTLLEEYWVLMEYTRYYGGSAELLAEPINGRADPRQKIFIGNANDPDPVEEYSASTGDYLTIQMLEGDGSEDSVIYIESMQDSAGYGLVPCQYSINGGDWEHVWPEGRPKYHSDETSIWGWWVQHVKKGDLVRLSRIGSEAHLHYVYRISAKNRFTEKPLRFNVSGNLTSILTLNSGGTFDDYERFVVTGSSTYKSFSDTLEGLFSDTSVVSAKYLHFPVVAVPCGQMFWSCELLTTAPTDLLPELMPHCYDGMFMNCYSLVVPPRLPITDLAKGCYYAMFYGCRSLETAPELPAEYIGESCYEYMFEYCRSLSYIKCLATGRFVMSNVPLSTYSWVKGVNQEGVFVKAQGSDFWGTGESDIPEGWTVEEA